MSIFSLMSVQGFSCPCVPNPLSCRVAPGEQSPGATLRGSRYSRIVESLRWMSSLASSSMMHGLPQVGLSRHMALMSARTSRSTRGRPPLGRLFHRQNRRNPARCQAITVVGLTMVSNSSQRGHTRRNATQKSRSEPVSRGRLT